MSDRLKIFLEKINFRLFRKVLFSLLAILSCCSGNFVAEVDCEKIDDFFWGYVFAKISTCHMNKTTEINSSDTTIASRDESIRGLWFSFNKKIKFLPIGVNEKFPNLGGLNAGDCSLTTISNENVKGLSKLRLLNLIDNQIEMIGSDIFDDLSALENLFLCKFEFYYLFRLSQEFLLHSII